VNGELLVVGARGRGNLWGYRYRTEKVVGLGIPPGEYVSLVGVRDCLEAVRVYGRELLLRSDLRSELAQVGTRSSKEVGKGCRLLQGKSRSN